MPLDCCFCNHSPGGSSLGPCLFHGQQWIWVKLVLISGGHPLCGFLVNFQLHCSLLLCTWTYQAWKLQMSAIWAVYSAGCTQRGANSQPSPGKLCFQGQVPLCSPPDSPLVSSLCVTDFLTVRNLFTFYTQNFVLTISAALLLLKFILPDIQLLLQSWTLVSTLTSWGWFFTAVSYFSHCGGCRAPWDKTATNAQAYIYHPSSSLLSTWTCHCTALTGSFSVSSMSLLAITF